MSQCFITKKSYEAKMFYHRIQPYSVTAKATFIIFQGFAIYFSKRVLLAALGT